MPDSLARPTRAAESAGRKGWPVPATGEYHLATTGQMGGIWTGFQRWGQKLVGNTFAGEGFAHSPPYRRMPDSYDPALAWITDGLEGELIGDFGLGNGGAAGIEIDCYKLGFGTPSNTKIIASSGGHPDNYIAHDEEAAYSHQGFSGTHNYILRADMVYFEAPNNGAVFASGSIAFGMALPINGFENNVSQLLSNVVNAFVTPGPLPSSSKKGLRRISGSLKGLLSDPAQFGNFRLCSCCSFVGPMFVSARTNRGSF